MRRVAPRFSTGTEALSLEHDAVGQVLERCVQPDRRGRLWAAATGTLCAPWAGKGRCAFSALCGFRSADRAQYACASW